MGRGGAGMREGEAGRIGEGRRNKGRIILVQKRYKIMQSVT